MQAEPLILSVCKEAQGLLDQLYAAGTPAAGSSLDQMGLRNGREIVEDYLSHGEPRLALEHLLYMIKEPPLTLSTVSRNNVRRAAELLGMAHFLPREVESDTTKDGGI
ncbi:MAG: hypothetical protein KIS92_23285 [Planctomycetota bacterium]|nr:hypothetical protein [Planctomycetota bacterium]